MSDPSLEDLKAASNVVWDYGVSGDLAAKLDAAATTVEDQVEPRNYRKSRYGTKFEGYYAELWADNIQTANDDADLLAGRLRDVATGVRDLEEDARLEQERIDADGVVEARNTYDDQGRVSTQTSPFGRVTRFAYLSGRVTAVSDMDGGRSNTWVADARGRLLSVTDSDGNCSRMVYDRLGNLVVSTDPERRRTVRQFDQRSRLITELAPSRAMTRLAYDDLDRLTDMVSLEDGPRSPAPPCPTPARSSSPRRSSTARAGGPGWSGTRASCWRPPTRPA